MCSLRFVTFLGEGGGQYLGLNPGPCTVLGKCKRSTTELRPQPPHLFLGVHLQDVHQVDHDVLMGLLVLSDSQRDSEPAWAPRAHEGLTALFLPFPDL
jgi:hypothetical protein